MRVLSVIAIVALAAVVCATPHKVTNLPGLEAGVDITSYTGYVSVNSTEGGNLWYWFFESDSDPANDPVILWMTGGPGCSGSLAVFYELGPFRFTESGGLTANDYAWNKRANVIFIDQPFGTGFSYVDGSQYYVDDETEVSDDVYQFILNWFGEEFPQYQGNEFFVIGESYGGHYVPAVAARVVEGQKQGFSPKINFQGAACGNGMTAAQEQWPGYEQYANEYNLVTSKQDSELLRKTKLCEDLIKAGTLKLAYDECLGIVDDVLQWSGINPYDRNLPCEIQPLCYNFQNATNYLTDPAVLTALGISSESATWSMCNFNVNGKFERDWMVEYDTDYATVLNAGFDVMLYYGELDFICNYIGGEAMANTIQNWAGTPSFNSSTTQDWYNNGNYAGSLKYYENMYFVRVANAGHMVPMDQPANAFEMVTAFINHNISSLVN